MLGVKHLFRKYLSSNKHRCCQHIGLSLRKDLQMTEEVNAETGLPAVKNNRLNPRNRITIAHWVNLQKARNRDPGKKSVCQR